MTQDETFTGGLCLITMDPDSNFIILEQTAAARDQTSWNAYMEPALAPFNCLFRKLPLLPKISKLTYGSCTLQ